MKVFKLKFLVQSINFYSNPLTLCCLYINFGIYFVITYKHFLIGVGLCLIQPTCIKPQTLTGLYKTFVKPKYTYEAGLSALLQNQRCEHGCRSLGCIVKPV